MLLSCQLVMEFLMIVSVMITLVVVVIIIMFGKEKP